MGAYRLWAEYKDGTKVSHKILKWVEKNKFQLSWKMSWKKFQVSWISKSQVTPICLWPSWYRPDYTVKWRPVLPNLFSVKSIVNWLIDWSIDQLIDWLIDRVCSGLEVIVEPPTITLRQGDVARFDCSARSSVDVQSIEWSREGARLPEGYLVCLSTTVSDGL